MDLLWLLVLGAISIVGWTAVLIDFASAWDDRRRRKRHEIINLTPIIPIARARMLRRQRIPIVRDPHAPTASPGNDVVERAATPSACRPESRSLHPQGHRVRFDPLRPFDHCHDDDGPGAA